MEINTEKILAILKAAYPHSYKGLEPSDLQTMVNLWAELLGDISYAQVDKAVKGYITSNNAGFPPTIGQIRDSVFSSEKGLSPQEASAILVKAISRSGWHSQEEFDKLPPAIKRVVRDPEMLRQWSQMDSGTVNSVVVSNFQRSYKDIVENDYQNRKLPDTLKTENILDNFGQKLRLADGY